jgi:hypothetical protein
MMTRVGRSSPEIAPSDVWSAAWLVLLLAGHPGFRSGSWVIGDRRKSRRSP